MCATRLPNTKTRQAWESEYTPHADRSLPSDGELVVREFVGRKVRRTVTDWYEVSEHPLDTPPGRLFVLEKTGHDGDLDTAKGRAALARVGELYEVALLADGRHFCSCPAGQTEKARPGSAPCIHVLALRAKIAKEAAALRELAAAAHADAPPEDEYDPAERVEELDAAARRRAAYTGGRLAQEPLPA